MPLEEVAEDQPGPYTLRGGEGGPHPTLPQGDADVDLACAAN